MTMVNIKPFRATRYAEKQFSIPPVAPPYDIISESERVQIAEDPHNIIHIDKPGKAGDADQYDRARGVLNDWKQSGVLLQDSEEAFYVYEQEYQIPEFPGDGTLKRRGFFGALKLESYDKGVVLPHERTLSGPKVDRMNLIKKTKANTSPIFGLYHDDSKTVSEVLAQVVQEAPLYHTYVDQDGTKHTLWKLTDSEKVETIQKTLQDKKVMIADGHHRYETSLQYRDYLLNECGEENDNAKHIMICLVDFADPGLVVLPTHRKLTSEIPRESLLDGLEQFFQVEETTKAAIQEVVQDLDPKKFVMGLYTGGEKPFYSLKLKRGVDYEALMPEGQSPLWKELNVNILFYVVIKKILGLDAAAFQRDITYTHSFKEALESVRQRKTNYVFLLQSINKFQVKKISEAGELMPTKSTYFFPKLYTGFVMYEH